MKTDKLRLKLALKNVITHAIQNLDNNGKIDIVFSMKKLNVKHNFVHVDDGFGVKK